MSQNERIVCKTLTRLAAAVLALLAGVRTSGAADRQAAVLHIHRTVTVGKPGFPQFATLYHVLDGAGSPAAALALSGDIALLNATPDFSEVLWLLAFWQGRCPRTVDQNLTGATIIWSDILKNPRRGGANARVTLPFARDVPMTGCLALVFGGGPAIVGRATLSADLRLTYRASPPVANTVVDLSGEYCFGQDWGCQNAARDDRMGFAVPITVPAGHLVQLFGNISDSSFDGTGHFGPLPTGKSWGASNDFYLLPGGCGRFGQNLNGQGFPNPVLLSTLSSWLPENARRLERRDMRFDIPAGGSGRAALQAQVNRSFTPPIATAAGDCLVVIYGRRGNGATDDETQVHALFTP